MEMERSVGLYRKFLIFVCFLLFVNVVFSQNNTFTIKGVVMDQETQNTLSFVNVYSKENTSVGTTSKENGLFELSLSEFPQTIVLSYLGYENYEIDIKSDKNAEFVIYLKPDKINLPTVEVMANRKIDTVFAQTSSVTDYFFVDDMILLMAYGGVNNKYSLYLMRENLVLDQFPLKEYHATKLFQNCNGDIYLFTKYSAYPISLSKENIVLNKRVSLEEFQDFQNSCVLATERFLYFSKYYFQGQALEIHAFPRDTLTDQHYQLPIIQNVRNIDLLVEETGHRMPWSGDVWQENVTDEFKLLRESKYGLVGIMKIFYPELYVPIFESEHLVYIFNHLESRISILDAYGKLIDQIPIAYHHSKKWKKKVYFDAAQSKAYTSFDTKWGEQIVSINLKNGSLGTPIPINLAFIEKIKIRNGALYFLYKNSFNEERNRRLQKIKID